TAAGANPQAGITLDSSGDLFGTTSAGGGFGDGAIFEILQGTSAIVTIATFNGANGATPLATLTLDSGGDLFGTTEFGGANNVGTVFEIVAGTSAITTIASFNTANGAYPYAGLTLNTAGALFGTTEAGGSAGDGTVFEIVPGASAIATLASFNGANGSNPYAGVTLDSSGNLFGTAEAGGSGGDGTVFEIVQGTSGIVTVASFNNGNGSNPQAPVTLDSSGNLFGTTFAGGQYNDGAVFEISHGTTTITTLFSFNGADGASPSGGITLDSNGDLFGTTQTGAPAGAGGVFELAAISRNLAFAAPTASATVGSVINGAAGLQIGVFSSWGNVVTNDSSQITLTLTGGVFSTGTNTAAANAVNGVATFNNLSINAPGTYTLTATDPVYSLTTSTPFTVTAITSGVTGQVFNDVNNNGSLDSGEAGQSAVNVTLTPTGATAGGPVTVATAADGSYAFANVNPGTYAVSETLPNGFALTAPLGGLAPVVVVANTSSIGPTFGNVLISSVTLGFNMLVALSQDYTKAGTFANGDLNGDGTVDFNDLVLLSQYYNQTLPPGAYVFSGPTPAGLPPTPSIPQSLAKSPSTPASASISGTIFNDINGDSIRQIAETGLTGRTVDLEIAGKGAKGERTAVTDSKGKFSFANLPAENYVLIVPTPVGWRSTSAAAGGDALVLKAGANKSGLLFGQQIIPPFTVSSTRAIDPLDHTKDVVAFHVRNNGVGATAGTRDVLAIDATLYSVGGLLIRTDDADGSGLLDDADFAGENSTPTASYIRVGGTGFFVAATIPSAKTDRYRDMQLVPSFEVAGSLLGNGVAANGGIGTSVAVAVVPHGDAASLTGQLAAEKGPLVAFSYTDKGK
ncbi:MAG TPA: choice-of-anchor tandem repeat GloVer-containing protein, partial [Humisphaera sp.]|nr:choice-of-anchor tandem repeat GloVer-containing protein [Humisphaera sp.]